MMYKYYHIPDLIKTAEQAITWPVNAHGVLVFVDTNPDDIAPDIYIDPADDGGLKIFREFASKMAAHYKSLNHAKP
jgi:hypothetical protein